MSSGVTEQNEGMNKKIRRAKIKRIVGVVLIPFGFLCMLLGFIPSQDVTYRLITTQSGTVVPYPIYTTSYPYQYMIVVGLFFMVICIVLTVSSTRKIRKMRNGRQDGP